MAVTARPNAPTASASSHGAPSPRIGLCGRSTRARPGGCGDFDVGETGGATLSPFDVSSPVDEDCDGVVTAGAGDVGFAVGVARTPAATRRSVVEGVVAVELCVIGEDGSLVTTEALLVVGGGTVTVADEVAGRELGMPVRVDVVVCADDVGLVGSAGLVGVEGGTGGVGGVGWCECDCVESPTSLKLGPMGGTGPIGPIGPTTWEFKTADTGDVTAVGGQGVRFPRVAAAPGAVIKPSSATRPSEAHAVTTRALPRGQLTAICGLPKVSSAA